MPTITTADGTEIFYKDWGSGQPIVFSHGWPLSSDDWDTQMMFFLLHGYRVVASDRRGHGRSEQTDGGHDMDHYADDLAAVVEHLDLHGSYGHHFVMLNTPAIAPLGEARSNNDVFRALAALFLARDVALLVDEIEILLVVAFQTQLLDLLCHVTVLRRLNCHRVHRADSREDLLVGVKRSRGALLICLLSLVFQRLRLR